jgi:hypothetical protein
VKKCIFPALFFIITSYTLFSMPGGASFTPFTPRQVFAAFQDAYPGIVGGIEFRNGDLSIEVRGERFYWAGGRLLPEEERENWKAYDAFPFYHYPKGPLPPLPVYSETQKEELLERTAKMDVDPVRRHPGFYNALWRLHDRQSSWERMKTTYFLGLKTEIHRELLEDLAAVEEELYNKAARDPVLAGFLSRIGNLEGYNWRTIAGTSTFSFHSHGIAIDIIPYSYEGKQVYWRWTRQFYREWFSIPYSRRFVPPEAFIETFERHGFIWGGKWLFFDTIHFEYRPEVLIVNGFRVERH